MSTNTAPDIEFPATVVAATPRAIVVTTDRDPLTRHWLPKSQVTVLVGDKETKAPAEGERVTVQCPKWLAERREIVF